MCCSEVSSSELCSEKLWGMWTTPARRAPFGWCMAAIFVRKRWCRESFIFRRGRSSCLGGLIPAVLLYSHEYSTDRCKQLVSHLKGLSSWHVPRFRFKPFKTYFLHFNSILFCKIYDLIVELKHLWRFCNLIIYKSFSF